jgi:hypothetical protein
LFGAETIISTLCNQIGHLPLFLSDRTASSATQNETQRSLGCPAELDDNIPYVFVCFLFCFSAFYSVFCFLFCFSTNKIEPKILVNLFEWIQACYKNNGVFLIQR